MQMMNFGKIQKINWCSKFCIKIDIFDHSGHVNDELWPNPENLLAFKLWLKIDTFNHSGDCFSSQDFQ